MVFVSMLVVMARLQLFERRIREYGESVYRAHETSSLQWNFTN